MKTQEYIVIAADTASETIAQQVGMMMPALSPSGTEDPIPTEVLEAIIQSPDTDLLLAVREDDHSVIGGVAVINLSRGVIVKDGRPNIKGWLEDFVVTTPRQGIGSLLWDAIIDWCKERDAVVLNFTSNPTKEGAHKFYLSKPHTKIRATGETAYFSVDITKYTL